MNPSPAAINFSKLDHFNGLHIRNLDAGDLAQRTKPFFEKAGYQVDDDRLRKVTPLIQQRIVTLEDAPEMGGFFFEDQVAPDPEELIGNKMTAAESAEAARKAYERLGALNQINHDTAEQPMRDLAEQLGLKAGQLFGILRVAVTGRTISPPLFETMEVIGKETVLTRIQNAVELLAGLDA